MAPILRTSTIPVPTPPIRMEREDAIIPIPREEFGIPKIEESKEIETLIPTIMEEKKDEIKEAVVEEIVMKTHYSTTELEKEMKKKSILIMEGIEDDLRKDVGSDDAFRLSTVGRNLHNKVEDRRAKKAIDDLLLIPLPEDCTPDSMIAECRNSIDSLGTYMELPKEWLEVSPYSGGKSKTKKVLELLKNEVYLNGEVEAFSFEHIAICTPGTKMKDVIARVWSLIRIHHQRQYLTLRLAQEIHEGETSCVDGKMKRIINCLFGFIDLGFNTVVGNGVEFQASFSHKVLRGELTLSQRKELANEVLNEYGIFGKARDQWIDCLEDF